MAFANGDGQTRFFSFFLFCSLAEEARRCVDVHVHRVYSFFIIQYIEDTYVRSISMYEVSVPLLQSEVCGLDVHDHHQRYTYYVFFAERDERAVRIRVRMYVSAAAAAYSK